MCIGIEKFTTVSHTYHIRGNVFPSTKYMHKGMICMSVQTNREFSKATQKMPTRNCLLGGFGVLCLSMFLLLGGSLALDSLLPWPGGRADGRTHPHPRTSQLQEPAKKKKKKILSFFLSLKLPKLATRRAASKFQRNATNTTDDSIRRRRARRWREEDCWDSAAPIQPTRRPSTKNHPTQAFPSSRCQTLFVLLREVKIDR